MTRRYTDSEFEGMSNDARSSWAIRQIVLVLEQIATTLDDIRVILQAGLGPQHISSLRITVMPKKITVGQTATAHVTAANADGSVFGITATNFTISATPGTDVAIGAPTFNADGSADVPVTGVNADAADVITATVDGVSGSDTLDIVATPPPAPATVTVTLQ